MTFHVVMKASETSSAEWPETKRERDERKESDEVVVVPFFEANTGL